MPFPFLPFLSLAQSNTRTFSHLYPSPHPAGSDWFEASTSCPGCRVTRCGAVKWDECDWLYLWCSKSLRRCLAIDGVYLISKTLNLIVYLFHHTNHFFATWDPSHIFPACSSLFNHIPNPLSEYGDTEPDRNKLFSCCMLRACVRLLHILYVGCMLPKSRRGLHKNADAALCVHLSKI